MPLRAFALSLLVWLCACQPPPPESPTWFSDVQPMVMANCARCHGADPENLTISGFRLDRYVKLDSTTLDAYDFRDAMVSSAALRNAPAMPPDYALTDRQRQTLERWVELGAPKGQRDNHPPEVERVAPVQASVTVDQTLEIRIRSWDLDSDGLAVRVGLREVGTQQGNVLITTGGGLRDVTLDTAPLASGRTYEVYAVLDDGYSDDPTANAREVVVLPNVVVDHGTQGSAPTVRLLAPNGGQALPASAEIAWTASDPDPGDVVTIDLELLEIAATGSATAAGVIAAGLPNTPSTYPWNTAAVPAARGGLPIQYKVRVVARDAGNKNVRVDDSDAPFTIATTTTYTWADVRPVFIRTCSSCHGASAQQGAPDTFRLDKYNATDPVQPINSEPGVYELRDRVYQRMVERWPTSMPPLYAPEKPTSAEIALIADWINGGAPR
ncbi:MAG TPA: hypothetical protein VE549_09495 [Myxococcaceae bacterium]|nr:hypothetical protein [Myxococcaceae bacterium]